MLVSPETGSVTPASFVTTQVTIAMGRSFENRKASIFKTAGQKSKLYSKYGKQLYVAAKNGVPDPENNPALRSMIERSRRFHCQSAVVLVDFTNLHKLREEFGRKAVLEVLLRLAGRLTSLVRDVDTVARMGEARFGILIEGPIPPDRGASVGSKVLARLIMPFSRMPMGLAVRPKIAVALVPGQGDNVQEVLDRLDAMLKEASPDYRKNIFVADSQPV